MSGRPFNLTQALLDGAPQAWDGLPALRFPGGEWTYAELRARAGSAAAALRARGVGQGRDLVLTIPDSPEWVALFLGAVRVGAVVSGVSPKTASDVRNAMIARLPDPVVIGDPGEAAALAAPGRDDPGPAATRADDPCYMLMTSGSTGPSKWAVHHQRDIAGCIATYGRRVLRLRPGDVTASVAALPTSYGLGNSCYFPLGAGACAWIDPEAATPEGMVDAITRGGVTAAFGVPTSWARLQRHLAGTPGARGIGARLRIAASAGEALPGATWNAVHETLGVRLLNSLGSSEASNFYLTDRAGAPRAGTVGWPVPGFSVRVVRPDGTDATPGTEGEAWARGPSVMAGYRDNPEATARTLIDGWLRTGDLVVREPDGSHTFLGRMGDRFKAGGFWIDPVRIQDALMHLPAVGQAVVMSVEDAAGLTRVGAVATCRTTPPPAPAELRAMLAGALAGHEVPAAIAWVDELPTTPNGKVRRDEARRLATAAVHHHHDARTTK